MAELKMAEDHPCKCSCHFIAINSPLCWCTNYDMSLSCPQIPVSPAAFVISTSGEEEEQLCLSEKMLEIFANSRKRRIKQHQEANEKASSLAQDNASSHTEGQGGEQHHQQDDGKEDLQKCIEQKKKELLYGVRGAQLITEYKEKLDADFLQAVNKCHPPPPFWPILSLRVTGRPPPRKRKKNTN